MITAPESSVQFTDEQTKQLETFKSQLLNLNTDISIHLTNLRSLQNEIIKATKENASLVERNDLLEKKALVLEEKLAELRLSCAEMKTTLETDKKEHEVIKKVNDATRAELVAQEKDLNDKRAFNEADRSDIDKIKTKLAEDSALLQRKHSILLEALDKIGNRTTV